MRWRQLRWCLAGVLGCVLATPAEGRSPQGSDEEQAREVERLARRAAGEGRKEEAVERFRTAWGLFKDPWFQCNMGRLEAEMGRARDAAQSLSICLRLLKPEDKEIIGRTAERLLNEVRAKVGALRVEVNVPDAEVVLNGKVLGMLPLPDPIFVDPGSHTVEVRAPGYHSEARLAVLHAGTRIRIPMRLEPMRVEVAPPMELAPVEPKPKPKEEAKPPVLAPLAASAKATDPIPARDRVPEPANARAAEPARASVRGAVVFTGFGMGVAGAVVGTVGIMAANANGEEAKEMYRALAGGSAKCSPAAPGPCKDAEDNSDMARVLTGVGVAGFAVSAVGGALLVYELVQSDSQGRKMNARLSVEPTLGGGALKLIGSF